jgi:hypothetical protein
VGCRSQPNRYYGSVRKLREREREREREKKYRIHERGMDVTDRWNRRTEKTDRIYEENRIIPWNMNKDYVWKIKNYLQGTTKRRIQMDKYVN